MGLFRLPWSWKRKIEDKPPEPLIRKKVYCKDCVFFRVEENPNYYMRGNGGQSWEEFNYKCDHPNNVKRIKGYYDTFKGREPIYNWPNSPELLNHKNTCPWHTPQGKEEPSWEK